VAEPVRRLRLTKKAVEGRNGPAPVGAEEPRVQPIRLSPGQSLVVQGRRTEYDFIGRSYYQASRELSAKLPHLGLTATEYDVFHHLLGTQERGGIIRATQEKIAKEFGIGRKEVGEALRRLAGYGLIWRPTRGVYRINPRVAFYGRSSEQAEAIQQIPPEVPELDLPEQGTRPPRRRRKLKEAGK